MIVCTKSLLIDNRLLIKSAILMPTAKDGEVSIVQVVSQIHTALQCGWRYFTPIVLYIFIPKESEGYKEEKVIAPMVAMKGGKDYQRYVDILIP